MIFRQLIFIVTYLLLTVTSSNGMDNTNAFNLDCIEEITAIKYPVRIRYCTDKKLAIFDRYGCGIILDLQTKESRCIAKENSSFLSFPILEYNNKKLVVAHLKEVTAYNRQTREKEWYVNLTKSARSIALDESSNTLFLCYGEHKITKYNYVSNEHEDIHMGEQICQLMTINPQKETIGIADYAGYLSLRKLNNIAASFKNIIFPVGYYFICKYTLDGSRIIAGNCNKLYIIDPDENGTLYPYIDVPKYQNFYGIDFHPNGLVLATVTGPSELSSQTSSQTPCFIHYWNLKTQELIDTTYTVFSEKAYDLCFSDDGLGVVVALKDKCIRLSVPFAMKEKCSYLLFVLNQLKEKYYMPKDIVRYCMYNFLEYLRF